MKKEKEISTVRSLRDQHFFWIDNSVMDNYFEKMGPYGFAVYGLLARMADSNGRSFPGIRTIAKRLKISKNRVLKSINNLEELKLLSITKEKKYGDKGPYLLNVYQLLKVVYSENQGWSSERTTVVHQEDQGGLPGVSGVVHQEVHNNNPINNTQEQTPYSGALEPEIEFHNGSPIASLESLGISQKTWADWKAFRREIKRPFGPIAESRALIRLAKLKNEGNDPTEVIEQSITLGWPGLFPLRNDSDMKATKTTGYAPLSKQ